MNFKLLPLLLLIGGCSQEGTDSNPNARDKQALVVPIPADLSHWSDVSLASKVAELKGGGGSRADIDRLILEKSRRLVTMPSPSAPNPTQVTGFSKAGHQSYGNSRSGYVAQTAHLAPEAQKAELLRIKNQVVMGK